MISVLIDRKTGTIERVAFHGPVTGFRLLKGLRPAQMGLRARETGEAKPDRLTTVEGIGFRTAGVCDVTRTRPGRTPGRMMPPLSGGKHVRTGRNRCACPAPIRNEPQLLSAVMAVTKTASQQDPEPKIYDD